MSETDTALWPGRPPAIVLRVTDEAEAIMAAAAPDPDSRMAAFGAAALQVATMVHNLFYERRHAADGLFGLARRHDLLTAFGDDAVQAAIAGAMNESAAPRNSRANGHEYAESEQREYEPLSSIYGPAVMEQIQREHDARLASLAPRPGGPAYREASLAGETGAPAPVHIPPGLPLTIDAWLDRNLPPPDCLLGDWLTTTSRALLIGPTGLGKTNFGVALGLHVAAGAPFLHWHGRRSARVLSVDREMSRRIMRERIRDAVARFGSKPAGFHAFSHEDVEGFAPLNTAAGQALLEGVIASIGGVDLIVFDSIMCLLSGDPRETESWQMVMPWVRSLTKRNIGQLWLHHTGHDPTRGYGDKSREWQMDTVLFMEAAEHAETDISFNLEFRKARERTPANRGDFQTTRIMLLNDAWLSDGRVAGHKGQVSPLGMKFLGAVHDALAGDDNATTRAGRRATTIANWRANAPSLA